MTPDEAAELLKQFFPLALVVLAKRMVANEPQKKGKWKTQSYQEHLCHLDGHWHGVILNDTTDDNLAGVGIRDIMAIEKREQEQ